MSGLSTRQLDRLVGLPSGYTWALERGGRARRISADVALSIARVLGCSVEWLVTGEGQPPTDARVRRAVTAARAA